MDDDLIAEWATTTDAIRVALRYLELDHAPDVAADEVETIADVVVELCEVAGCPVAEEVLADIGDVPPVWYIMPRQNLRHLIVAAASQHLRNLMAEIKWLETIAL